MAGADTDWRTYRARLAAMEAAAAAPAAGGSGSGSGASVDLKDDWAVRGTCCVQVDNTEQLRLCAVKWQRRWGRAN